MSIYSEVVLPFKLLVICATIFWAVFLFLFSLNTAVLCKAAHSPYKRANSFVAEQSQSKCNLFSRIIETRHSIKLLNFLERLGGPEIAVYCLDLFPLNYYEIYEFIAAISANSFLGIDL